MICTARLDKIGILLLQLDQSSLEALHAVLQLVSRVDIGWHQCLRRALAQQQDSPPVTGFGTAAAQKVLAMIAHREHGLLYIFRKQGSLLTGRGLSGSRWSGGWRDPRQRCGRGRRCWSNDSRSYRVCWRIEQLAGQILRPLDLHHLTVG